MTESAGDGDRMGSAEAVKRAVSALRAMKQRVQALETSRTEPIAIVGMGCRFPGNVFGPDDFWQLLETGTDAVGVVPDDRWSLARFYDPDRFAPGKISSRSGAFLADIARFDNELFGISPREAAAMDPQQRMLLEVCWSSLEDANIAAESLYNSRTGVFVGICPSGYARRVLEAPNSGATIDGYFNTGAAPSVAAGRISFAFGFVGPCIAIDTACSSALVAVHYACQSLRLGECDLALAGGVNAIITPEESISFSRAQVLSPEGRCKTFDAGADGYVRGEGCGVVVLERLSDALARGRRIIALVRGSAVNQDGPSGGLTVPNGPSQEALVRSALAKSGIEAASVSYVEAHGTGTPLGDPIEVGALGKVYCEKPRSGQPLFLGSVKTNIGHAEAAAGIAGLCKVALALDREKIPPNLHFKAPNPHIPWGDLPVLVPTELTLWPKTAESRFAGVSSFGFSGTNAHVILESAPARVERGGGASGEPHLFTLSAKNSAARDELCWRYIKRLRGAEPPDISRLCATTNLARTHLPCRLAVVAGSIGDLLSKLEAASAGHDVEDLYRSIGDGVAAPRIAYLFSGQGSQYSGMGRLLYETQPVFREILDRCDGIVAALLGDSLLEVMFEPQTDAGARIDQIKYTHPAMFSLEYALGTLLRHYGVEPDILVGHSTGEYAAACLAEVFSLEEGLTLITRRGCLMQALPQSGRMLAVFAPRSMVEAVLDSYRDQVDIAAINGPENIVISGKRPAIAALKDYFAADGIETRDVKVAQAAHSFLIKPMLEEFRAYAEAVNYSMPTIDIISTVYGRKVENELCSPDYWCDHLQRTVRFTEAVAELASLGVTACVEIGPNSTLLRLADDSGLGASAQLVPTLSSTAVDTYHFKAALARFYCLGVKINWDLGHLPVPVPLVSAPTYPFQGARYWPDAPSVMPAASAGRDNSLLGERVVSAAMPKSLWQFEVRLPSASLAAIADHVVFGQITVPGAAYITLAAEAARRVGLAGDGPIIHNLEIRSPLTLERDGLCRLNVIVHPSGPGGRVVEIHSLVERDLDKQDWILHARALLPENAARSETADFDLAELLRRLVEPVDIDAYYGTCAGLGISYQSRFRTVKRAWRGVACGLGWVERDSLDLDEDSDAFSPAILDGCLQVLGAAIPEIFGRSAFLPVGIDEVVLTGSLGRGVWCYARLLGAAEENPDACRADLSFFDDLGRPVGRLSGLQLLKVDPKTLESRRDEAWAHWLYRVEWIAEAAGVPPYPAAAPADRERAWLILANRDGVARRLERLLGELGQHCVAVIGMGAAPDDAIDGSLVDFDAVEQLMQLFQTLSDAGARRIGIVDLRPSEAFEGADADTSNGRPGERDCIGLLRLLQAVARSPRVVVESIHIVTREAQAFEPSLFRGFFASPVLGMIKVAALEYPDTRFRSIDLDGEISAVDARLVLQEVQMPLAKSDEIVYRRGERYIARLVPHQASSGPGQAHSLAIPAGPFQLAIRERGSIDSLSLDPCDRPPPGPGEVEIRVYAAGLNFMDVMDALGSLPIARTWLGGECAGEIVSIGAGVAGFAVGEPVVAIALGALRQFVVTDARLVVRKPSGLSFCEAATIPGNFLTAHYALVECARLAAGETILIHAASGGTGAAAVQIARACGARIIGTASRSKWLYLRSSGVDHILDSRTTNFGAAAKAITGGGVDVVLNALTGAGMIDANLLAIRPGGRFIEMGKRATLAADDSRLIRGELDYRRIDLADLATTSPALVGEMLRRIVAQFEAGRLHLLPFKRFAVADAVEGFRFMQEARHIGKIVFEMPRDEAPAERPLFDPSATYLLAGGTGGLGLLVGRWAVECGARNLVILGKGAARLDDAALLRADPDLSGVNLVVRSCDISDADALWAVLDEVRTTMPRLKGVFQLAAALHDRAIFDLSTEQFLGVLRPKAAGTWNLHNLTMSSPLDFFVMFSSISSLLGNFGQSSYAAGNAFLDTMAAYRRSLGRPALSINWPAWSGVGAAARQDLSKQLREKAMTMPSPEMGLQILSQLMRGTAAHVAILPVDWRAYDAAGQRSLLAGLLDSEAKDEAILHADAVGPREAVLRALRWPEAERLPFFKALIRRRILTMLRFPENYPLADGQALSTVGFDSLMSMELRHWLNREIGVSVALSKVLGNGTIEKIVTDMLAKIAIGDGPSAGPANGQSPHSASTL